MSRFTDHELRKFLRAVPRMGSAELCKRLGGVSRATLKRALDAMREDVVVRGGSRRIRYALRRSLRGRTTPLPLFRIDREGRGHEAGYLELTLPEGSALSLNAPCPWPLDEDMADGWFETLPYFLFDMRPQRFLGRHFARRYARDLQVSENPQEWSDDDILHALSLAGWDQPGDLILGEVAFQRFLETAPSRRVVSEAGLCTELPATGRAGGL